MNPIQKEWLVIVAVLMLAMLIYPPWVKITNIVTPAAYATPLQTETQESAGYSWLLEPPKANNSPPFHYASIRIDYARLVTQWAVAAFVLGAGLLYFKGSDKKSLTEWWSSVNASAKPDSPPNPPNTPPPDSPSSEKPKSIDATLNEVEKLLQAAPPISEMQAPKTAGSGKQIAAQSSATKGRSQRSGLFWTSIGLVWVGIIGFIAIQWVTGKSRETQTPRDNPHTSIVSALEETNNAIVSQPQPVDDNAAIIEAQAAAEFEKDFYQKYPDLRPYGKVCDDVAAKLRASGYKGESREAVMKTFAKAAREELGRRFEQGDGGARDYFEAFAWYSLSAAQGDMNATASQDRVYPQATAEFEREFYETNPALKPYEAIADWAANDLAAKGLRGTKEQLMKEFADATRAEIDSLNARITAIKNRYNIQTASSLLQPPKVNYPTVAGVNPNPMINFILQHNAAADADEQRTAAYYQAIRQEVAKYMSTHQMALGQAAIFLGTGFPNH
jgi:hypothetical protein